MKIPISLLRKLCNRIITYLDDMLLMGATKKKLLMARDTLIYLLQGLSFLISIEKSVLYPHRLWKFLGVVVNSQDMSLNSGAMCRDSKSTINLNPNT